jgi:isocitrate dehydrogenase (NAD+)
MAEALRIIVLEGDETGQELLDASLRVLEPDVLGFELELERFDLGLEKRRETDNQVVHDAAIQDRALAHTAGSVQDRQPGSSQVG